jgi:INO80 complex subunit C
MDADSTHAINTSSGSTADKNANPSLKIDFDLVKEILAQKEQLEKTRREHELQNSKINATELLMSYNYSQGAQLTFKQPAFQAKRDQQRSARKQLWRPAKNIINAENSSPYPPTAMIYSRFQSTPSNLPAKHYCDWTHQLAMYTDPRTRLRYANKEVFAVIRTLRPEQIKRLLELRRAQPMELS